MAEHTHCILSLKKVAQAALSILRTSAVVAHDVGSMFVDLFELAPISGLAAAARTLVHDALELFSAVLKQVRASEAKRQKDTEELLKSVMNLVHQLTTASAPAEQRSSSSEHHPNFCKEQMLNQQCPAFPYAPIPPPNEPTPCPRVYSPICQDCKDSAQQFTLVVEFGCFKQGFNSGSRGDASRKCGPYDFSDTVFSTAFRSSTDTTPKQLPVQLTPTKSKIEVGAPVLDGVRNRVLTTSSSQTVVPSSSTLTRIDLSTLISTSPTSSSGIPPALIPSPSSLPASLPDQIPKCVGCREQLCRSGGVGRGTRRLDAGEIAGAIKTLQRAQQSLLEKEIWEIAADRLEGTDARINSQGQPTGERSQIHDDHVHGKAGNDVDNSGGKYLHDCHVTSLSPLAPVPTTRLFDGYRFLAKCELSRDEKFKKLKVMSMAQDQVSATSHSMNPHSTSQVSTPTNARFWHDGDVGTLFDSVGTRYHNPMDHILVRHSAMYYDRSIIIESESADLKIHCSYVGSIDLVRHLDSLPNEKLGFITNMEPLFLKNERETEGTGGLVTSDSRLNPRLIPEALLFSNVHVQSSESTSSEASSSSLNPKLPSLVGSIYTLTVENVKRVLRVTDDPTSSVPRSRLGSVQRTTVTPEHSWHKRSLVLKLSFPPSSRTKESELIDAARAHAQAPGAEWALRHLPLVVACVDNLDWEGDGSNQNTLQHRLKSHFGDIEECEGGHHRTPVQSLLLRPIPENFSTVHRWLYEYPKILHRDLSMGNIMFRHEADNVYGVINDFDLSSFRANMNKGPRSKYRTGTKPSIACNLLDAHWDKGHLYRRDLEALFYIVLIVSCHYSGPITRASSLPYRDWFDGADKAVASLKFHFLQSLSADLPIQPYFDGFTKWLRRIHGMLDQGYKSRPRASDDAGDGSEEDVDEADSFNWETFNEKVRYTKMMKVMHLFEGKELVTRWGGGSRSN
ncbi:hypothetical protein D9757_010762 [Collybiopsis confluens]|uniref:Fungal-type protein kinase domain-containing protein n=1 Tax=Collybiopsis confluens TaxID=2823264 RepID=A0A8H5M2Z0_9AGAR|nr:hypothetical protein D9757_010762 [Collybiopsis confluens]